jgi:hypothetical protein
MLQQGQFNKVGVAVFLTCLAIGLGVARHCQLMEV